MNFLKKDNIQSRIKYKKELSPLASSKHPQYSYEEIEIHNIADLSVISFQVHMLSSSNLN